MGVGLIPLKAVFTPIESRSESEKDLRSMKSMKPPPKFAFCCSDGFDLTEKRSPYPAGGMI